MHLQTYDCVLCDEAVEVTIDHLFLHCEFARLEPSWVKCPPASRPISSSRFFFPESNNLVSHCTWRSPSFSVGVFGRQETI